MFNFGMAEWLFVLFIPLAIAGFVFWIIMLLDAIKVPDERSFKSGNRLVWVLVIVLAGWIGALIYLLAGRPDGGAKAAIARGPASGSIPPPPPPPV